MVQNARTATAGLLLAALCWGVATALSKVAIAQLEPVDLFAIEVCTGAVSLGIAALLRGARPGRPSAQVVLLGVLQPRLAFLLFDSHIGHADAGHLVVALGVGILASVVPFLLYNAAIARVTATAAGLTLTLVPLFGTLASLVLLREPLAGIQLAGGACVVAAAGLAATGAEPDGGLA
jgi:drug/metabolite transporter (DMT)-like permease